MCVRWRFREEDLRPHFVRSITGSDGGVAHGDPLLIGWTLNLSGIDSMEMGLIVMASVFKN